MKVFDLPPSVAETPVAEALTEAMEKLSAAEALVRERRAEVGRRLTELAGVLDPDGPPTLVAMPALRLDAADRGAAARKAAETRKASGKTIRAERDPDHTPARVLGLLVPGVLKTAPQIAKDLLLPSNSGTFRRTLRKMVKDGRLRKVVSPGREPARYARATPGASPAATPKPEAKPAPAPARTVARKGHRREQITRVLRDAGSAGLTAAELADRLKGKYSGDAPSGGVLSLTISELKRQRLVKAEPEAAKTPIGIRWVKRYFLNEGSATGNGFHPPLRV